jgi:hypothetical protein
LLQIVFLFKIKTMAAVQLVDSLVNLLTSSPKPEDVLAYKVPTNLQERASLLLEKNRAGALTEAEKEELDQFVFIEHIFRMAKARARIQLAAA